MSIWTDFVRAYAKKHGITYPEAMRKAGPEYRKKKTSGAGMKKRSSVSGSKKSYKKAPRSRKLIL